VTVEAPSPAAPPAAPDLRAAILQAATAIGMDGAGAGGLPGFFTRMELLAPQAFAALLTKVLAAVPPPPVADAGAVSPREKLEAEIAAITLRRVAGEEAWKKHCGTDEGAPAAPADDPAWAPLDAEMAPVSPDKPAPADEPASDTPVSIVWDARTNEPATVLGDVATAKVVNPAPPQVYALVVPGFIDSPTIRAPSSGRFVRIEGTPDGRIIRVAEADAEVLLQDGRWATLNYVYAQQFATRSSASFVPTESWMDDVPRDASPLAQLAQPRDLMRMIMGQPTAAGRRT
jgi:hypothetical protein